MSLALQPPELLDTIASFVAPPSDLLALALTNKALHDIVIPHHLEFREVCCDARRETLWKALADLPVLSGRINSLELLPEPYALRSSAQLLIPYSLSPGTTVQFDAAACNGSACIDLLSIAISSMSALKRFSFGQTSLTRLGNTECLFRALRLHCPNLRELEITFYDGNPSFDSFSGPIWELRNLTLVSITVTRHAGVREIPRLYLAKVFDMLSACPDLRDLRIASEMRGPAADISGFLADQVWPDLRRLVMEGDVTFNSRSAVEKFLARHPKLEALSLPEYVALPDLPNLQWLYTPEFSRTVPAHTPRLEYAVMSNVYWSAQPNVKEVMRTLRTIPTLRGATLDFQTTSAMRQLARELPRLERLVLTHSPWNADRTSREQGTRLPSADCIAALTSLSNLTHLDTSATITIDEETDIVLDGLLRSLSNAPKLEFVGVDFIEPDSFPAVRWYSIMRGVHSGYAGRKEIRNVRKIRYHGWDDAWRDMGISV
ncbi:hypothetical protein MVEN_01399500 [Mycena venus]|uniref:F-box domain-containing protein n=1 Tax=Mycena venus TaxID=2733690 RepID=A0A8H6XV88_9AGAR|nr:hypothetical protein MVEN_01399500 [Mycena venus]